MVLPHRLNVMNKTAACSKHVIIFKMSLEHLVEYVSVVFVNSSLTIEITIAYIMNVDH